MKKKLSVGMAIVLALLALGMAAALASGMGILNFRANQTENSAFVQQIFSVGQTYEDQDLTLRLNDAVFDGTRLMLTMDILPKEGGQQVFVHPRITAAANGEQLPVLVQQYVGAFPDGFWVPNIEGMQQTSPENQYVVIALTNDNDIAYAAMEDPVDWAISFDVYRPNWPIALTREERPSVAAGEPFHTDEAAAMNAGYDAMFAQAYANRQILVFDGFPAGSLDSYGDNIPHGPGAAGGLSGVEAALQSDAFTRQGQAKFTFTTRAAFKTSPQAGQTFALTDGWQAELIELKATIDHIDCVMKLTRDAADGKTATQAYQEGEHPWDFALVPQGGAAVEPKSNGYGKEDGSMIWIGSVEIMAPVSRITVVPCRSDVIIPWIEAVMAYEPVPLAKLPVDDTTEGVYGANGPITKQQQSLAFTLDVE